MKRRLEKSIVLNLKESTFWRNYVQNGCRNQNVFLAIRDNRIDIYHKGGKLFTFDNSGYKTHIKYASVIESIGKDYLSESELASYKLASDFETNYERIKENCSNYSGIEAVGVSEIYHRHSYFSKSNVVVLDAQQYPKNGYSVR